MKIYIYHFFFCFFVFFLFFLFCFVLFCFVFVFFKNSTNQTKKTFKKYSILFFCTLYYLYHWIYLRFWLILGCCIVFVCLYCLNNLFSVILFLMLRDLLIEVMWCLIFSVVFVLLLVNYFAI